LVDALDGGRSLQLPEPVDLSVDEGNPLPSEVMPENGDPVPVELGSLM
jgi:hypothetical protein